MSEPNITIDIAEQPSLFHKFRYESEVAKGNSCGYLYSRRPDGKSPVRLIIRGIDNLHNWPIKSIVLIGGIVSSDYYPHPYQLFGDHCTKDGLYRFEKDIASLAGRHELVIPLEKLSLVCVKKANLAQAVQKRLELKFNPYNKNPSEIDYSNVHPINRLKAIRLAFQVFCIHTDGTTVPYESPPVTTEEIKMKSEEVKLNAFGIHPTEAHVASLVNFWIYFEDPLNRLDCPSYSAKVTASDGIQFNCTVVQIKKHLVVVSKPNVAHLLVNSNERIRAYLTITDTQNDVHCELEIVLLNSQLFGDGSGSFYQASQDDPPAKRKRPEPANPGDVDLGDLYASFFRT